MPNTFPGFSRKMPTFFRGLEKNNTREWFTPRKEHFEEHVRRPMIELVTLVNDDLKRFAIDHVAASPARTIYRIYRDTRFSKDKTPYKTHVGATFARRGLPKHGGAGFYFGVSHKHVEVAGGIYMPEPEQLAAVRRAIIEDYAAFRKLTGDKRLTKVMGALQGDRLARLPKGYEDHADLSDWLRLKQLYWYVLLPAELALTPRLRKEVVSRFELMADAMDWMNRAVFRAVTAGGGDEDEARPKRPEPMW
jgi:uncharacterized protein (TIGR02453 family)